MCCTISRTSKSLKSSIIGKPYCTTSFRIVDPESGHDLPLYSVGELAIGGYQVARGYYKNSSLTKEKFICCKVPEDGRLYRSGDLARMLEDGSVEFIGRRDDQVKLRGQRIELQEIDSVIRRSVLQNNHSAFRDVCTLILSKSGKDRPQLVTFICLHGRAGQCELIEPSSSELEIINVARDACKDFLPYYMLPSEFVPISSIPLSAAGKLQKGRLQTVFESFNSRNSDEQDSIDSGVLSETNILIRDIFSTVSGVSVDDIKTDTTIYQLGMDSISATQISALMRRLKINVTAVDVLKV